MAIELITGVPGAGKTLLAVQRIKQEIEKNPDRLIYSDIDGLNFGDSVVSVSDDDDWRQYPDGSLVIYDEVHRRWPASGKSGMSNNDVINDLDQHRHRGFDFILLTQFPTKVHFEVRTNVGIHTHVARLSGFQAASLFTWQGWQGKPDDRQERQLADVKPFKYPKSLYQHYKSATIHTHKPKIPARLIGYAVMLCLIVSAFLWVYKSSDSQILSGSLVASAEAASGEALAPAAARLPNLERVPTFAGCIGSTYQCQCYLTDGSPVSLDLNSCLDRLNKPLPIMIGSSISEG